MDFSSKWVFVILILYELTSYSHSYSAYPVQGQPFPEHVDIDIPSISAPKAGSIDPFDMLGESHIPSISAPKAGWIDPFDMLGESRSQENLFVQSDVQIDMLQKRCSNHEMYLRRFVNLFLNAAELRGKPVLENSMNLIKLEFLIEGKDINTLISFGEGQISSTKVEFVSEAFTRIFSQKTPQSRKFVFSDIISWFQSITLKIISSPEWTVLSSITLMLALTLWFIYKTHSYHLAVFTVLLTIFLAGFGFTWIRMYEEMEIERYVNMQIYGTPPKYCTTESQSMAWYEHMFYRMFGVDCHEFYKIRDVRPIVKISPTDVLSETVSSMFVKPASNIGKAYGNFINSILGSLPWWLKGIALPLALLIPPVFTIILIAFFFNYRLSLSITGFHLIPSWSSSIQGEVKNNGYIEECSRKESNSVSNSTADAILNSDKPLFVMNWNGLKKLSSSTLLKEKRAQNKEKEETSGENQNKEEKGGQSQCIDGKRPLDEDDKSLTDEDEIMIEDLKELENLVESLEQQKLVEERRKRRSIHTYNVGENSLTNRSDVHNTPMIEYSHLPPGDSSGVPGSSDNGKKTN